MNTLLTNANVAGMAQLPKGLQRFVYREAHSLLRRERMILYLAPMLMVFVGGLLGYLLSVYFLVEFYESLGPEAEGDGTFSWFLIYLGCVGLGGFVFGFFGSLIRLKFLHTYLQRALETCIGRVVQTSNQTVETNRRPAP